MPFKPGKSISPFTKGGKVTKHEGKGSTQERLPNRHAMSTLAGGSPMQRTMNNYSKATPSLTEASADVGPELT